MVVMRSEYSFHLFYYDQLSNPSYQLDNEDDNTLEGLQQMEQQEPIKIDYNFDFLRSSWQEEFNFCLDDLGVLDF
ncbi:hypothetical protein H5410_040805 [Solanum commersonii]|uniref:Uncharacterized protein n=1 Tax=Solanum commersonii TaxID=4109 RepID=A0A9J5XPU6_SOLCO|nr:hypothetical protein H5410_040805 [Solanum commersonii]